MLNYQRKIIKNDVPKALKIYIKKLRILEVLCVRISTI